MLGKIKGMLAIVGLLVLAVAGLSRGATGIFAQSTEPSPGQIARSERRAIDVRGPYLLSSRLLGRLGRIDGPAPTPQMLTATHDFPDPPDPCDERDCEAGEDRGEGPPRARTPEPTGQVTDTGLGGLDPEIAASDTHLVVTNGGGITFFDKSGGLSSKDKYGAQFTASYSTREFFKPLWEATNPTNINTFLNLPAGAVCDATADLDNDAVGDGPFCLDSWYDTRVVFDTYRKRFWITALARNSNSRSLAKWDDESQVAPAYQLAARRTKAVTAVSITDDPRDGWYLYWWDAVVDDGQCVSASEDSCAGTVNQPGDGADYPSIAVSFKYLVQTNAVLRRDPDATTTDDQGDFVNDWMPRYSLVVVMSADGLANGGSCNGPCGWGYFDIRHPQDSNTTIVGSIQPAHSHGLAPFGRAYMTNTWGKALLVWGIDGTEFGAPLQVQVLPLDPPPSTIVNSDQPPAGDVTDPKKLQFSNLGNLVVRAYERNGLLHAIFQDCRKWESSQTTCSASLRLVRVNLAPFPGVLVEDMYHVDRTFGLRNDYDDAPDAVNGYGNPGLSVNGFGDVVAVYNRVGPTLFPEARYSAFMFNEPDIRPSALLRAGEFPWGSNDTDDKPGGNVDTGGSGVDPYDDTAVWLAQPYAYQGSSDGDDIGRFELAIGKVFGDLHPDLVVYVMSIQPQPAVSLQPAKFSIQLRIENHGDGPVQEGRGEVMLSTNLAIGPGDHPAASFSFGAVPPGGTHFITLQVTVPDSVPAGSYYVGGRIGGAIGNPEYSTTNNVTFIKSDSKRVLHKLLLIPIP